MAGDTTSTRRFSLRWLLVWLFLLLLSFGYLRLAFALNSPAWLVSGLIAASLALLLMIAGLQRFWKRTLAVFLILLAIYAGMYAVLSSRGNYQPAVWGLYRPKVYSWAPLGFVHNNRWRTGMFVAFYPLWLLDTQLWHAHDDNPPTRLLPPPNTRAFVSTIDAIQ